MRPALWTREKCVAALQELAARSGQTPTTDQLWKGKCGCPSIRIIRKLFGSTRAAMIAAGLKPRRPGGKITHGRRVGEKQPERPRRSRSETLRLAEERAIAERDARWRESRRAAVPIHSHDPLHLHHRTDGNGRAYLECWCGYTEPVVRQPDPFPTRLYRSPSGRLRRGSSRSAEGATPPSTPDLARSA